MNCQLEELLSIHIRRGRGEEHKNYNYGLAIVPTKISAKDLRKNLVKFWKLLCQHVSLYRNVTRECLVYCLLWKVHQLLVPALRLYTVEPLIMDSPNKGAIEKKPQTLSRTHFEVRSLLYSFKERTTSLKWLVCIHYVIF